MKLSVCWICHLWDVLRGASTQWRLPCSSSVTVSYIIITWNLVFFFFILAGNCFSSLWLHHSAVVLQEILWLIRSLKVVRFISALLKPASHRVHSALSSVVTFQTCWSRLFTIFFLSFGVSLHSCEFLLYYKFNRVWTLHTFCACTWDVNWKYSSCEMSSSADQMSLNQPEAALKHRWQILAKLWHLKDI